jgi:mono/diheme cytochrome c family protein
MPNLFLEPIAGADGKLTDPAADIATFLLGSKQDWQPKNLPNRELSEDEQKALFDLALEYLKTVFTRKQAETYLKEGIPQNRQAELKGDEVELAGEMSSERQLQYVGRRTISKYGCSGCHDVPGFEDAKPIGTGLADWARKTADKLAFEQIVEYMKVAHGAPGPLVHKVGPPAADVSDERIEEAEETEHGHREFNFLNMPPDTGYFMEKLVHHQREGFIWQKLREPRSYDYKKTQNKGYNERLRMPQFTALDDKQREAIITFVLGLVAEPPAQQYVYRASPRRAAIAQGQKAIEKFNCTGCHTLAMDQWKLAYAPADFPDPAPIEDYPFLKPRFTPQQIAGSTKKDDRGLMHATLIGMPMVDEQGQPTRVDEDGAPLEPDDKTTKAFYPFIPWQDVLINGQARQAGRQNLLVPAGAIEKQYPPMGGFLARLAYPTVVAAEKAVNPNVKAGEAWGWLPPPLVGEGHKVQTAWLHDFLLDPHPIRPAVVLRMPKFNMSPDEATALANYFAAVDGAEYPYDFDSRTRSSYLTAEDARHPNRFSDALKIVIDNNYCVKCHFLGDFDPKGSERAKGPQLAKVYNRLRPEFMQHWLANPQLLLPYTSMPTNIPFDKGVSQSLYKGTPEEQLSAVVDLLLNYDAYAESKTTISTQIKPAAPAAAVEKPSADARADAAK